MSSPTTKPSRADERLFSARLLVVKLFVIAGVLGLLARLAWLQIYQHEHYSSLSTSNSIRANFLSPPRGRIFDRDGRLLATNRAAFSLQVLPSAATDIDALVLDVRQLIGLSTDEEADFRERLPRTPVDGVSTALLKEDLTNTQVAIIASQLYRLDGLSIGNFLRRVYPHGPETVAVLGHMGRISEDDWQNLDQQRYSWDGYIGKTGLELIYEDALYGQPGYSYVEIDAFGRIHRELDREPAVPGMDLHTNLSLDLQMSAIESLGEHRGAVLAMVPASGEVLALYSAPSYDNNQLPGQVGLPFAAEDSQTGLDEGQSPGVVAGDAADESGAFREGEDDGVDAEDTEESQDSGNPLFNRAISGVYPPASTIKPLLSLHPKLQELLPVEEELQCRGALRIGRRTFRDWKRSGHGKLGLQRAIAESCDIYYYRNALQLGVDGLAESMRQLGYGSLTGIDLPTESAGLVPTAEWKLKRYSDEWRDGDSANAGIGQGFVLATPLQMLVSTATLANRGVAVRPRLFRSWSSVVDATPVEAPGAGAANDSGSVQLGMLPEAWLERLPAVLEGMRAVIHSEDGTGRRLRNSFESIGVEAAGKTGTAQVIRLNRNTEENKDVEKLKDHSLFVGFAPFESPEIVVAVVAENAGNGSAVAAPIAGRLMREWLDRLKAESAAEAKVALETPSE